MNKLNIKATAITRAEMVRYVDPIFGRVESHKMVKFHRVQLVIGNTYFVGSKTYATFKAAERAAKRLEGNFYDEATL